MTPEQIGKAYDTITHLWEDSGFNLDNGIKQHQCALSFAQHDSKGSLHALDVGCGCTGRFAQLLSGKGYRYEGLDVSLEKIRLARKKNPEYTFHHADICTWNTDHTFDFITAWDSIWHIPLSEQENVISKLAALLKPRGILIFSFGGVDNAGEHTDDFMGPAVYYSSLGTNGFLELLIKLGCHIKHLEFDQHPELHTYVIAQKVEGK